MNGIRRISGARTWRHPLLWTGLALVLSGCFPWDYNKAKDISDKVENSRIASASFVEGDTWRQPAAGQVDRHTFAFTIETELDYYGYTLELPKDAQLDAPASSPQSRPPLVIGSGTVKAGTPLECSSDRLRCQLVCTYTIHAADPQLREINCLEDKSTTKSLLVRPGTHAYTFRLYATEDSGTFPWTPFSHEDEKAGTIQLE